MTGKEKHYFACANTSKGFINYFSSNLQGLKKIYILKGGPGTGKSTLMKNFGKYFLDKGFDIEYINCSSDPDSLDGVIIRSIGVGIVDGTAPHVIEPSAPGAIEEYVNLGVAWDTNLLAKNTDKILDLKGKISICYQNTYKKLAEALKIHDEWESIYISNMNFKKADELTESIIDMILDKNYIPKDSITYNRFFGGSTPIGTMDFVENVTQDLKKRYFLKGRPGSGKSTLLKKIHEAAEARGLDTEVYHCGFDPDSLDMVLIPRLSLCIFDCTAPHEYEPSRKGDSIIDLYSEVIKGNTDDIYSKKLSDIKARYKLCTSAAIEELSTAKSYHDELEKYYVESTDFKVIDGIYNDILSATTKNL